MMNKEEFTNEMQKKIATILPEDFAGAEITVAEHKKNNGLVLTGLTIHKPGSDVSPIIYLDQYYKHYCEKIATMDDILLSITQRIQVTLYKIPADAGEEASTKRQ